jgi:glycosyltransferase involved in cell wall biosynthesis
MPRISVVMATYQGERFLPEMLDSLATQSRLPDELVVRDDASGDATIRVLEDFARRAPFAVRVIPGEQRVGYAQNFVAATRECAGDLVFFADQDDLWRPGKLATVESRADVTLPQALFHDFALVRDGSVVAPSFYSLLEERGYPPDVSIKGCTMAVTRPFLDLWDWPDARTDLSHDFWIALLSMAFGQRLNLPEQLVDHRLHDANASGWVPTSSARVFTTEGDGASPVAVLVDLVLKPRHLRQRTRGLLEAVEVNGERIDPRAARRLRRVLRTNRRRYRERRRTSPGRSSSPGSKP